jgi:cytochrome c oxidase subunit 2
LSESPDPEGHDHARRIATIVVVAALIATPLVWFVLGPALPPGDATLQGEHQTRINQILATLVTPVVVGIVGFLAYAIVRFRRRDGDEADGPPVRGNHRITTWWVVVTVAIVVFAVSYGTWDWMGPGKGSGSAQGAVPISVPDEETFEIQVIGQQWQFTYRYPDHDGLETQQLVMPAGAYVELHVTSLDVIHSFWAPDLGLKADAVPGADNIVYARLDETLTFQIRCAELCGLWHGQMYQLHGRVVEQAEFDRWIAEQQDLYGDVVRYLPDYDHTYFPDPDYRAG